MLFKNKSTFILWSLLVTTSFSSTSFAMDVDTSDELAFLQQQAKDGKADAQFKLGQKHMWGEGVEQDEDNAIRLFIKAADRGHLEAQRELGRFYDPGDEDYDDEDAKSGRDSLHYYKLAAKQGDLFSLHRLAEYFYWGTDTVVTEPNHTEAFKYAKQAADQTKHSDDPYSVSGKACISAQLMVSMMYFAGEGIAQNHEEGLKYYKMATTNPKNHDTADYYALNELSSLSNGAGEYIYGMILRDGISTENYANRNMVVADYFAQAAAKKIPFAEETLDTFCEDLFLKEKPKNQYRIGKIYEKINSEKAFKFYKLSADKGWSPALVKMGQRAIASGTATVFECETYFVSALNQVAINTQEMDEEDKENRASGGYLDDQARSDISEALAPAYWGLAKLYRALSESSPVS